MSGDSLNIDVYHKGVFAPNPFVYFHPHKLPVTGLDVCNMDFKEWVSEFRDENDYVRFLDGGFDDDDNNQINIYIDDYLEPLLDWTEEEKAEEGDISTDTYEDDMDLVLSNDLSLDHEGDDVDIQWHELVDPFLSHKNCIPEIGIEDEVVDKSIKDGWIKGCRRLIGVDGCFLKDICRGELLKAVVKDANNQMYPLAWAVVLVENKETWMWFVDLLLEDI
ncbi:unnamed protein product [Lactuca saligna]|uniref:MULE transposase domain-containing protein n=1 Tax=Lactuca saligna TaxID=75948 RepID=A0AA36A1N4_LACSI|nr:unnamed protein product [Lactuca saligna]